MVRKMIRLLVPLAVVAVAACGPAKQPDPGGTQQPVDEKAPEFTGGGQEGGAVGADLYPGPYGIGTGSVIKNYKFYGFPRPNVDNTQMGVMQLADFYNPTGTDTFPAGSPYGEGTPKPLAMILDRSAVWCGPCNYEAANEIPVRRPSLAPKGEWLLMLGEGPLGGDPATQNDLHGWSSKYKLEYPAVIDPNGSISEVVGVDAWPGNVLIRTRDMKIVTWTAGVPDDAFYSLFQDVINGKPVLPGDQ